LFPIFNNNEQSTTNFQIFPTTLQFGNLLIDINNKHIILIQYILHYINIKKNLNTGKTHLNLGMSNFINIESMLLNTD